MEIPITVKRQNLAETLVVLINNSGLPAFVVAEILEKLTAQVNALARQQYQDDLEAYKKAQEDEKAKAESEKNAKSQEG